MYTPLIQRGYTIKDTIGVGGYSKVKMALYQQSKQKVAIKVIAKKNAPEGYLEKFLPREIIALEKAKHGNIARLYEVVATPDHVFLIMQYAQGGDLLDFINKNGTLTEERARTLFGQIVDAMVFAHKLGIYHRDLKCENILLDENGNALVSDFGFAVVVDDPSTWLMTHCGSYAYAAPEILNGKPYRGDKSDIWSMGVVLYAMVCGRLPFRDKTVKLLLEDIRRGITFHRVISRQLQDFMYSILEPDVNKRATLEQLLHHPWLRRCDGISRSVDKNTITGSIYHDALNPSSQAIKTNRTSAGSKPDVHSRENRYTLKLPPLRDLRIAAPSSGAAHVISDGTTKSTTSTSVVQESKVVSPPALPGRKSIQRMEADQSQSKYQDSNTQQGNSEDGFADYGQHPASRKANRRANTPTTARKQQRRHPPSQWPIAQTTQGSPASHPRHRPSSRLERLKRSLQRFRSAV
eukprot:gene10969-3041_t